MKTPAQYIFRLLLVLSTLVASRNVSAVGEQLIEAVMRSDFIFDRDISNVPFFPLGYLTVNQQKNLQLAESCNECEFDHASTNQGFGMPVWVGQKNMLLLGESLESDVISRGGESTRINSAGVLGAWVSQVSSKWQAGGFLYAYRGLGSSELKREPRGNISGLVGRYRHRAQFHSYWGLVRLEQNSDQWLYPYIGFDWYLGKKWSVSGVLPWPTINYAPTRSRVFKVGALLSGTEWFTENDGELYSHSFSKVDFGFAYEQRLWNMIWAEMGVGYSGFGKIEIQANSEIEFASNIKSAPFLRLSLSVRPE